MELKVPLGSGLGTCGCRRCGEVFTSLTGFERHQRKGKCLDPAEIGLVQRPNGRWSFPPRETEEPGEIPDVAVTRELGHFLPSILHLVPPEPIGEDEDGNPLYPEPGPSMTLTERPLADVVAEAGFRPPAQRIEITADFCQCPACREARCEA
jgi:hypothetical protein